MKRLVVTADDAGLHPGMTAGALAGHDAGFVTAVSLAAVGPSFDAFHAFDPFDDAVERLRERPALDVGVHLTLVGERPLSPPREIPSLVGRGGALLPGFPAFVRRYALGGIAAAEVERELRRQVERVLAAGLPVVHLNAHQHLHVLPRVFEVVLRLQEEHRIPFVRIPSEPAVGRRLPSPRSAQLAVLNRLGRRARRRLEGTGRGTPVAATVGVFDAGRLTFERLRRALADVGNAEGTAELVCHPGMGNDALSAAYGWGYAWDEETAALCDPRIPALLRESGFELSSFSSL